MASPKISIRPALEADLPAMIAITCAAMAPDPLTRLLYGENAVKTQTESLNASLGKRFTAPSNPCFIFIAVTEKGVVGWILVRWEEGMAFPPSLSSSKPGFQDWYSWQIRRKWASYLEGRKHVVLGALYVKPEYQGQGVGRKLVEYIYEEFALEGEEVIVQTRERSEGFYGRLGWRGVGETGVEMGEWGERVGGWSRSPMMVRGPVV